MAMISRSILLAASLLAASTVGVLAQSSHHDAGAAGGLLSNPPRYPSPAQEKGVPADENPNVPGATGRAIVRGDRSSEAGDRRATIEQRTGTGASDAGGD
jgi:hypothetical protein